MSQKTVPPQLTEQQIIQKRVGTLFEFYKNPIREMLSKSEEVAMGALNELIQNQASLEMKVKNLTQANIELRAQIETLSLRVKSEPVKIEPTKTEKTN